MSDPTGHEPMLQAASNRPRTLRILHVANWYPNSWDDIEGNFVKAQFDLFRQVTDARLVHVQVRTDPRAWLRFRLVDLGGGERGYYVLTRFERPRVEALLTTMLLLFVLLREKAWRFDLMHFHIAWPLLAHAHLWRWLFRKPVLISEHYSAYHFKFHLPEGSAALRRMRRPFQNGFPVVAVSRALLADIRTFAGDTEFAGYVIPNFVPLHGWQSRQGGNPVLFAVNRWNTTKDPMPMLNGLARAAEAGSGFNLVIGGYGVMIDEITHFVDGSALAGRTRFLGKMTKAEIAAQLAVSDGYVFSSRYETFSIACAEALGAGVPLIGPSVPAIAEYASPEAWECVETRDAEGWANAIRRFLARLKSGAFDNKKIAAQAAERFSSQHIQEAYSEIVSAIVEDGSASSHVLEKSCE